MKANKYLVFVILFNLIGSTLCSQQVYFNNRYHLSGSESFYASTSIFEYNDNYYMTGATDDTINQSWRWVFFSIISDSGGVKSTKYLGNNANDYYPAWPGSFAEHENNFFFAGNMRYYGPFHQAGLLVKLNSNLDTIWSKEYIGDLSLPYDSNQHFNNMHICEDGSFIFTGELYYGQQPSQMVLLKADTSGNQQWVKYFGATGLNAGYSVIQTSDDGFAIGGFWYVPGSSEYTGDPIVIKTDSLGNKEWEKNLGGPHQDNSAILYTGPDGSIIVGTLYADSMSGNNPIHGDPYSRIHIVKLDIEGNVLWDKKYGKSDYKYNYLTNIRCLDNGSIIACGTRPRGWPIPPGRSGWAMKVTADGDSLWYRYYELLLGENSQNQLKDIIPTSDNGFLACGYVFPMQPDTGTQDAWVIKLDSMGCDTPGCSTGVGIENPPSPVPRTPYLQIFPNPASSEITIRCRMPDTGYRMPDTGLPAGRQDTRIFIYDLFGRKQDEIIIPPGKEQTRIDISSYPAGVYVAVLKSGDAAVARGKFVKH